MSPWAARPRGPGHTVRIRYLEWKIASVNLEVLQLHYIALSDELWILIAPGSDFPCTIRHWKRLALTIPTRYGTGAERTGFLVRVRVSSGLSDNWCCLRIPY